MIETYLRPFYQKACIDPLAQALGAKVTPNHITILASILGIGAGCALALQMPWVALILLLLSGICDTLDGTLARMFHRASNLGTVLDIVSDRIVEFAIIFGLFALAPLTRGFETMAMLGSILICVTSFLVVGIFSNNQSKKGFHYSPGIMERPEAFTFFIAMILLPEYFSPLAWVFSFLVLMTAVIRIHDFKKASP